MRTGRGAAVGVVTELVDVETTLGVGVVAGDVPGDGGGGVLVVLLEGDGARHLGVTTEDSNYMRSVRPSVILEETMIGQKMLKPAHTKVPEQVPWPRSIVDPSGPKPMKIRVRGRD